jgi:hypothetical protein
LDSRGPESPVALELPADDRIGLNVHQGDPPSGPQPAEGDPEYSIETRQDRSLAAPSKGSELQPEGGILDFDRLMTAE